MNINSLARELDIGGAQRQLVAALAPTIRVSIAHAGDRSAYERHLRDALKGSGTKYSQIVAQIAANLAPEELSPILRRGDAERLAERAGIGEDQAERIIDHLRDGDHAFRLETVKLADEPLIELKDGEAHKNAAGLSTGQRCTVILPILLLESERPLLIDQPEDNLDNAYIYDTVVRSLREAKGGRQLIFVTHNPNIPVLGEAERVGYGVTEGLFTAAEVGAPHRRQRRFALARRLSGNERDALRVEPERGKGSARPAEPGYAEPGDLGEDVANAEGVLGEAIERRQPDRDDAGVADADRRQPPGRRADPGEAAGREPHRQPRRSGAGLADADGERRQQTERGQAAGCRPRPSGAAVADTERSERRPGQPVGHVGDRTGAGRKQETDRSRRGRASQRATLDDADGTGSQGRSDDACQRAGERPAWPPGPEDRDGWERFLRCAPDLEPAVRRDSDGLAYRVDRLRLCGNGVVPLVAAHAWRTLKARFDGDG